MTLQDFFFKGVFHAVFKGVFIHYSVVFFKGVFHAVFKGFN